jgi:hypothetical protein
MDYVTPFYPQKLALTSPTSGGRSVGIAELRIQDMQLLLLLLHQDLFLLSQLQSLVFQPLLYACCKNFTSDFYLTIVFLSV